MSRIYWGCIGSNFALDFNSHKQRLYISLHFSDRPRHYHMITEHDTNPQLNYWSESGYHTFRFQDRSKVRVILMFQKQSIEWGRWINDFQSISRLVESHRWSNTSCLITFWGLKWLSWLFICIMLYLVIYDSEGDKFSYILWLFPLLWIFCYQKSLYLAKALLTFWWMHDKSDNLLSWSN